MLVHESAFGLLISLKVYVDGRLQLFDLFPKGEVVVRYTTDEWSTWRDMGAQLVHVNADH